jgi:hypothetical protein
MSDNLVFEINTENNSFYIEKQKIITGISEYLKTLKEDKKEDKYLKDKYLSIFENPIENFSIHLVTFPFYDNDIDNNNDDYKSIICLMIRYPGEKNVDIFFPLIYGDKEFTLGNLIELMNENKKEIKKIFSVSIQLKKSFSENDKTIQKYNDKIQELQKLNHNRIVKIQILSTETKKEDTSVGEVEKTVNTELDENPTELNQSRVKPTENKNSVLNWLKGTNKVAPSGGKKNQKRTKKNKKRKRKTKKVRFSN